MIEVPRWEMHEFELHGRSRVENPFRDAALVGEFTAPSGTALRIEGFHDGSDAWRLRFAPTEEGEWRYRLRGEGVAIAREGRLRCIAPRGHGPIRIHPENPYAFAHADGTAFFPMGDTCYGLYDDSPITPALRREYLETRRRQRFNFVRMSVGHSEARAAADPAFWAWGGTPAKPDLDRLNPVFFRGLDELFRDLKARGMNVELLLLNFYRRPFTDTDLWTADRERLWLRHVIARYAAFDNLFLWTLANEYETRPDGRYRLDRPDDVEWAKATAPYVKQLDPFRHLVTVHPVVSSSTRGTTPRSEFEPPWRIGGFFGGGEELDVLSQQTSAAYAGEWDSRAQRWVSSCAADSTAPWFTAQWDETRGCWTGDVPGVNRSIATDRIYHKPVLNTENGYEYLPGHPTQRRQVHHTDKVRRTAWRIVCAGGYFAAGFTGTIGHSDVWNRIDAPNRYTFAVQDAGAAAHLGTLFDFFAALPFWRMQPFDGVTGAEAVALAEPGRVYVFYLPHGGKVSVDLSAAKEPLTACWFNPRDNAVFEDRSKPDFDPEANADRFISKIPDYAAHGVNAFTICLQGGMPGYEGAVNSAFEPDGSLRPAYLARAERIIRACDRHGVVVILGLYYQRQSRILRDEAAVRAGVVNAARWVQSRGFRNVAVEVANEYPHNGFAHALIRDPKGQASLVQLVKETVPGLLVTASGYGDGKVHAEVAEACDFLTPHWNGTKIEDIPVRVAWLKRFGKPIVCNEDDRVGESAAAAMRAGVTNGCAYGLMLKEHNQTFPFHFDGAADDPVYLHFMTAEGVAGMEKRNPKIESELTIPYVRNIMGPVSFTVIKFDRSLGSHAYQMAQTVVYEAGIQIYAERHDRLRAFAGVEFLKRVPAAWDEIRFLDGYPGSHAIYARRKGQDWFIGGMTDPPRTARVSLSFLAKDISYQAQLYQDGATKTNLVMETKALTHDSRIEIPMLQNGGFAVLLQAPK